MENPAKKDPLLKSKPGKQKSRIFLSEIKFRISEAGPGYDINAPEEFPPQPVARGFLWIQQIARPASKNKHYKLEE
jgi:hypothetical protein